MAERIAKRSIGVQDDDKDTYRRDTVSTSIWKRSRHPVRVGMMKLCACNLTWWMKLEQWLNKD